MRTVHRVADFVYGSEVEQVDMFVLEWSTAQLADVLSTEEQESR